MRNSFGWLVRFVQFCVLLVLFLFFVRFRFFFHLFLFEIISSTKRLFKPLEYRILCAREKIPHRQSFAILKSLSAFPLTAKSLKSKLITIDTHFLRTSS